MVCLGMLSLAAPLGWPRFRDGAANGTADSVLSTGVTPTRDADAARAPTTAAAAACCAEWPGGAAFLLTGGEISVAAPPVMSTVLLCTGRGCKKFPFDFVWMLLSF